MPARHIEEGLSRSFFGCGRKPLFPSTFAGGLKELLRMPMRSQGYCVWEGFPTATQKNASHGSGAEFPPYRQSSPSPTVAQAPWVHSPLCVPFLTTAPQASHCLLRAPDTWGSPWMRSSSPTPNQRPLPSWIFLPTPQGFPVPDFRGLQALPSHPGSRNLGQSATCLLGEAGLGA